MRYCTIEDHQAFFFQEVQWSRTAMEQVFPSTKYTMCYLGEKRNEKPFTYIILNNEVFRKIDDIDSSKELTDCFQLFRDTYIDAFCSSESNYIGLVVINSQRI